MNSNEKYIHLISDEEFQDDVRKFASYSREKQKAILRKYSITENEFDSARNFFSSISFKREKLSPEEVSSALNRLIMSISDNSTTSIDSYPMRINYVSLISRIAAFLTIPLLLSTIYFYHKTTTLISDNYALNSDYQNPSALPKSVNTFHALPGAKTQVVLPDGSLVWLNSGSSISCPTFFEPNKRQVELKGEAYFEVVKNEKAPLIVNTGHLKVKVYGTKFNVNAFADEGLIETTLVEGKVTIIPGESKNEYTLNPGYTAFYDILNQKLKTVKVGKMDAFTGWKDGKLQFDNERFSVIVNKLERWYNVDIQLTDPMLGDYTLYATFFDENIEQVLDIFSNSIPISISYPKRTIQADDSYSKPKVVIDRNFKKRNN